MPDCSECGRPSSTWYRSIKDDFRFHKCQACGLIFRDPPLWQVIDYTTYGGTRQKADWVIVSPGVERRAVHLYDKLHEGLAVAGMALSGKRLLEIGCGPGLLLNRLAREYPDAELYGLDPTSHHAPVEGYTRLTGTIEDAVLPGQFDVIAMFGNFMLHRSPSFSLSVVAKALKPGGVVIFDYKNPRSMTRTLTRHLHALGKAKIERQAFHGINFAPTRIEPLLADAGLSLVQLRTSHSLGAETGTGMLPKAIRLVDAFGQRAWIDVVASKTNA